MKLYIIKYKDKVLLTAVATTLMGGGGVYSYIHVLPDQISFEIQIYQFEKKLVGRT